MKLLLTILLIQISAIVTLGCCSAKQYKMYPLGYQKDKLIIAEHKMSRKCKNGKGAGPNNEFHWHIVVNLSYINQDTTVFIKNIDSLSLMDCICDLKNINEKSELSNKLLPSYYKAYKEASKLKEFKEVTPLSYRFITNTDTLQNIKFVNTDTTSHMYYKENLKLLHPINWSMTGYLNSVQEVRTYSYEDRKIVIVNLSGYSQTKLPINKSKANNQNFKSIKTALTYTLTHSHGLSRDYILEY